MKKLTPAFLALGFSLSSLAQHEPFDRVLYSTLWNNIPQHDSITLWYDSIHPNNLYASYQMELNSAGMLDTMVGHDHYTLEDTYLYSGKTLGKTHVVGSFVKDQGQLLPYERTSFVHDNSGRIDYVDFASFNGSTFEEISRMDFEYLPDNKLSMIKILGYTGSGYLHMGSYTYHYTGSRLDSMLTSYAITGSVVEKRELLYDNAGRARAMKLYEYLGLSGGLDFTTHYVLHLNNATDKIDYVEQYFFDHSDSSLVPSQVLHYSRKHNSQLGSIERDLARVEIYPIPATDHLSINGPNLEYYRLLDLGGKLMMQGPVDHSLDISNLPSGTYILHISDRFGKTAVRKIKKL